MPKLAAALNMCISPATLVDPACIILAKTCIMHLRALRQCREDYASFSLSMTRFSRQDRIFGDPLDLHCHYWRGRSNPTSQHF